MIKGKTDQQDMTHDISRHSAQNGAQTSVVCKNFPGDSYINDQETLL